MKKLFSILILILICSIIIPFALADGCIMVHDPDMNWWGIHPERQQYAVINYHYKDKIENMILAVDTSQKLEGDKAVWLFPVPSQPEEVDINIIKGFPVFTGVNLEDEANDAVNSVFLAMWGTQVYPLPLVMFFGALSPGATLGRGFEGLKGFDGVTVHERVEKMGLTTELVSAVSEEALTNYLATKNLSFPPELESIIEEYLGQDYSFVITWISDVDAFLASQFSDEEYYGRYAPTNPSATMAVYISFKTDKIYYPLEPTSVYGDRTVPAVIYLINHVQPELYGGIKPFTEVDYYLQSRLSLDDELGRELRDFFFGEKKIIEDLRYTKVKIDAPSNELTQDLWFKNEAPKKVVVYESLMNRTIWWGVILFLILSCLASLFAGWITFKHENPSLAKFFFFGLFNFLTLIGFWIAAYIKNVEYKFTQKEHSVYQSIPLTHGKKVAILVPLIILIIFILLIPAAFILELEILLFPFMFSFFLSFLLLPILAFVPLILWGYYKHKRILVFNLLFGAFFLVLLVISRILFAILI